MNESNYEYQMYFKNNSFGILIRIFFVDKEQIYEEYIYTRCYKDYILIYTLPKNIQRVRSEQILFPPIPEIEVSLEFSTRSNSSSEMEQKKETKERKGFRFQGKEIAHLLSSFPRRTFLIRARLNGLINIDD